MSAPATQLEHQAEQRAQFLGLLYGELKGSIDLRFIEPDGPTTRIPAPSIDAALTIITDHAEMLENVYCGVATRVTGSIDKGAGGKANLQSVAALWVDVDHDQGGDREVFEAELERFKFPPSLRVWSGNGEHVYWLLEEPFDLTTEQARTCFENILKGLADYLNADFRATDSSRILRVPGTTNYPDAKKRAKGRAAGPASIISHDADWRYSVDDFDAFEMRGQELRAKKLELVEYDLEPWDGELPPQVQKIIDGNEPTAARWNGETQGLKDTSDSGIDQSFANLLAIHGASEADTDHALQARRRKAKAKAKHSGYFARTVGGAFAWAKEQHEKEAGKQERIAGGEEQDPPAELPTITTNGRQLRDLSNEALAAIHAVNQPPSLFLRDGRMARIRCNETARPVVDELTLDAVVGHLSRVADFEVCGKGGDARAVHPPKDLARDLLARDDLDLPSLEGITETPTLRPDGSILDRPGYDAATRLCYVPALHFEHPRIPDHPTDEEVRQAAAFIAGNPFVNFPFHSDADLATAWAGLITPMVRPAIDGCVPLFLIDSPQKGTGKGLLVDVSAIVATGEVAPASPPPKREAEDEWRKRITSQLRKGAGICVIDNVVDPLEAGSLAALFTAQLWEDRVLGTNTTITLPARAVWYATGNNLRVRGDLERRAVWCRLDAKEARPWQREGFKHPDLQGWARSHRSELVGAVLTLARAWTVAGRPGPRASTPTLGGFERWRHVVGGILHVAGVPDFLGNLEELYDVVDEETPEWSAFLTAWRARYGEEQVLVADLVRDLGAGNSDELNRELPGDLAADLENAGRLTRRLGIALRERRDRRYPAEDGGTLRVTHADQAKTSKKSKRWRVLHEMGGSALPAGD